MLALIGTVLVTSFLDSLNPSASFCCLPSPPKNATSGGSSRASPRQTWRSGSPSTWASPRSLPRWSPRCSLPTRFTPTPWPQSAGPCWWRSACASSYRPAHAEKRRPKIHRASRHALAPPRFLRQARRFAPLSLRAPYPTLASWRCSPLSSLRCLWRPRSSSPTTLSTPRRSSHSTWNTQSCAVQCSSQRLSKHLAGSPLTLFPRSWES